MGKSVVIKMNTEANPTGYVVNGFSVLRDPSILNWHRYMIRNSSNSVEAIIYNGNISIYIDNEHDPESLTPYETYTDNNGNVLRKYTLSLPYNSYRSTYEITLVCEDTVTAMNFYGKQVYCAIENSITGILTRPKEVYVDMESVFNGIADGSILIVQLAYVNLLRKFDISSLNRFSLQTVSLNGTNEVYGNIESFAEQTNLSNFLFWGSKDVYGEAANLFDAWKDGGVVSRNIYVSFLGTQVTVNGRHVDKNSYVEFDENGDWDVSRLFNS